MATAIKRKPIMLSSDNDGGLLLASTRDEAEATAKLWFGYEATVKDEGWFLNVGWDRLNYDRKRDFIEDSGFTSWWEGVRAPADGGETAKLRRGWRIVYTNTSSGRNE